MDQVFLSVLNMSLTAGFVIAAVCAARLALKKAPKAVSYALWVVVALRLMLPVTFESAFSLLPIRSEAIPLDIAEQSVPRIESGIGFLNSAVSGVLPAPTANTDISPLQNALSVSAVIWVVGAILMLLYSFATVFLLKRRLRGAVRTEEGYYEAEALQTPFVLGLFRPKIYLPAGLAPEETQYILLHEQTHIRRRDPAVKMLAYLLLCIHWFNPLAWLAFVLMSADMELSCDERVLRELGGEIKKAYSSSLLSLATRRRVIGGSPLAFGEGGVKARIKNVLNFKKPSRWIIIASVAVLALLSAGLLLDRQASLAMAERPLRYEDVQKMSGKPYSEVRQYLGTPDGMLSGFWGDIYSLTNGMDAFLYYDSNSLVEKIEIRISDNWLGNFDGEEIKLNDLRALATKGESLVFADFADYKGMNFSSTMGAYTMLYNVPAPLRLIVGSPDGITIDRVVLECIHAPAGTGIDLRTGDLESFFERYGIREVSYHISLEELRSLAQKGETLTLADFKGFTGEEVGSGLYIMHYTVEGGYSLLVGFMTPAKEEKPMYASLSIPGTGESVDIRQEDVNAFLESHVIPDERNAEILAYLGIIESSSLISSATGNYIQTHQSEYDAIKDMGVNALPVLREILDSNDRGLRGNVVALLIQDILDSEWQNSPSDWMDGELGLAEISLEQWKKGFLYSASR